jgi:hypothetical protein
MVFRDPQSEIEGDYVHGENSIGEIVKRPGEDCESAGGLFH